jgi:GNAT superfamily N-acetyltransferase
VTTALRISTDPTELDVTLIHAFLSTQSSWARGIPLATLQRAIAHSLCFGAYRGRQQIGFARVVSDRATFAQLLDVFVLPEHRGQGCARALLQAVIDEPAFVVLR